MRVLVTGSSSHLSHALLPALCEHPNISLITGVDIKPCGFQHHKFKEELLDVRSENIHAIIKEHDTVIHMAFVVLRSSMGKDRKNRELARDINVDGSINVFRAALENNLDCLIHLSSASVYGALAGNPSALNENNPRQIMHGFSYAEDKNAVEDWLDNIDANSNTRVIRFRPHVILGPHAQPFLVQLLKQPFYPYFKNPQPQIQCTWEEDLVDAIIKALFSEARGIFNLASQPPTSFKEIIKTLHPFAIPLPFSLVKLIQNISWQFSSKLEEPGWIDGMQYSLSLDTSKAEKEFNWHASRSSLQCAVDALRERRKD